MHRSRREVGAFLCGCLRPIYTGRAPDGMHPVRLHAWGGGAVTSPPTTSSSATQSQWTLGCSRLSWVAGALKKPGCPPPPPAAASRPAAIRRAAPCPPPPSCFSALTPLAKFLWDAHRLRKRPPYHKQGDLPGGGRWQVAGGRWQVEVSSHPTPPVYLDEEAEEIAAPGAELLDRGSWGRAPPRPGLGAPRLLQFPWEGNTYAARILDPPNLGTVGAQFGVHNGSGPRTGSVRDHWPGWASSGAQWPPALSILYTQTFPV